MPSTLTAAAALIAGIGPLAGPAVRPSTTSGADSAMVQPVRLDVADSHDKVSLKVVGSSDRPMAARYTLRVDAGARGGMNQSSQGGAVHLTPGQEVTVVDLTVASGPGAIWSAILDVTCDDGRAYRIERRSADSA